MESNHKPLVVLRCKLVIVGDACVGKSAITQVFQSGGATFPKNYVMTIGAEFCVVQVPIPETDAIVELYIYDCAGQSIFNQIEMNAKYYDNAAAVLVVYDVTNRDTIKSCIKWVEDVRTRRGGAMAPIIGAVVGNKCEFRDGTIESRADVIKEDANRLAADLGCAYFECSAVSMQVT
jgi:transport family protein 27